MTEPLDLEPFYARIVSGYEDDQPAERLPHAIDDAALLAAEVERLRAECDLAVASAEHHAKARGFVEHNGLWLTMDELRVVLSPPKRLYKLADLDPPGVSRPVE